GWRAVTTVYLSSLGSALLLELVKYSDHYTVLRGLPADDSVIPPTPTHSWNTPLRLSNMVRFKLQRQSYHHTVASRPYQLLRNFAESPQLPTGYPGIIAMSFFPPVFRSIMDPLVEAHRKRTDAIFGEGGGGAGAVDEAGEPDADAVAAAEAE